MNTSALKWPIIGWIVVDVIFIAVAYAEGVGAMFSPATVTPLMLAFGAWVGYKTVDLGGGFVSAIIAGVIVGAVCGVLTIIGFGVVHGMEGMNGMAIYAVGMNTAGAVVGGGFALTGKPTASSEF